MCFVFVCWCRGQRLEESLEYQQFVANVEEEEAWINEKLNLVGSEDYGDTLAAVQVRQGSQLTRPIKSSVGANPAPFLNCVVNPFLNLGAGLYCCSEFC